MVQMNMKCMEQSRSGWTGQAGNCANWREGRRDGSGKPKIKWVGKTVGKLWTCANLL